MKKKRLSSRDFSTCQDYDVRDIVRISGRSTRTVSNWLNSGLVPLNPGGKPLIISGRCIKIFIDQTKSRKKCKLKKHEFWCSRERKATTAKAKSIHIIDNRRYASCRRCGCKINRFIGKPGIKERAP